MKQSGFTGSAHILGVDRDVIFDADIRALRVCDSLDGAELSKEDELTCEQALSLVQAMEFAGVQPEGKVGVEDADLTATTGTVWAAEACTAFSAIAQALDAQIGADDPPAEVARVCCNAISVLSASDSTAANGEELRQQAVIDELREKLAKAETELASVREIQMAGVQPGQHDIDMLDIDVRIEAGRLLLKYNRQKHLLSPELSREIGRGLVADQARTDTAYKADVQENGVAGSLEPTVHSHETSAAIAAQAEKVIAAATPPAGPGTEVPFDKPEPMVMSPAQGQDWVSGEPGAAPKFDVVPDELIKATKLSAVLVYLRDTHGVTELAAFVIACEALRATKAIACLNRISEALGGADGRVARALAVLPPKE